MPKTTAARTPAGIPTHLWAIRPDAHAEIVAAVEAGTHGELAGDAVEGRTMSARGAGGGAIAVIPIQGIIRPKPSILEMLFGRGGASIVGMRRMLRSALSDSSVGAIVLDVDSPGGFVDGVPELAEEIREARAKKPIVAIANTHAASAAYWLASQATELYVSPSGQVGSIGVFITHEEYSKLDERIGITTTLISAGRYKTDGNPYEPLSDSAHEAFQTTVNEYYDMFTGAVAKGRKVSASAVKSGYGEGRMVLATQAKADGMVDQVGTFEDAIARAADLSGGRGRSGNRAEVDGVEIELTDEQLGQLADAGHRGAVAGEQLRAIVREELARHAATAATPPEPPEATEATETPEPPDPAAEDDPWAEELAADSPSFRAALARQT